MKNKLSRLLLITLAVILSAASLPIFHTNAANASFCVSSAFIPLSESTNINIYVASNPGISSYKFTVTFDPALTLKNVEPGKVIEGKGTFDWKSKDNTVTVMWYSAEADVTENGELAVFHFDLPENAKFGDYYLFTVSYDSEDILNENIEKVPSTSRNGKLVICDNDGYLFGDTNNDGKITPKDVLLLRKYLGGAVKADEINLLSADIDFDGKITPKDVLMLRKYLGGVVTKLN